MSTQLLAQSTNSQLWGWWETDGLTASIKDRIAGPLLDALDLQPGDTVIEASSGNTAIALAALCAERGLRFLAVVPDSTPAPKVARIQNEGARILFGPRGAGTPAAVALARRLTAEHGFRFTDQHRSPANPAAHEHLTGPALRRALPDLTMVVVGLGTTGTFVGLSRCFARSGVRVVGVRPTADTSVEGLQATPAAGNPGWQIGPGAAVSVAELRQAQVTGARDIARELEITPGPSGLAVLAVAHEFHCHAAPGTRVAALLGDTMERYSTTGGRDATTHFTGTFEADGRLSLGPGRDVAVRTCGDGAEALLDSAELRDDEQLRTSGVDPADFPPVMSDGVWYRRMPAPAPVWLPVTTVTTPDRAGLREIVMFSSVSEQGPGQLAVAASLAKLARSSGAAIASPWGHRP